MSRFIKWFGALTIGAVVSFAAPAVTQAQTGTWTGSCTPDLIHVYADSFAVRCQQNARWYYMWVSDVGAAHVDRTLRAIQAAQLAGKFVQFHDSGPNSSNVNDRRFDVLALPK
jgi:hypothetical protein